jgi:predicted dehydrogenase
LPTSKNPTGIVVCGAGTFGRNHLRLWRALENEGKPVRLAAVVDSDTARADAAGREWGVPAYPSVEAALEARASGGVVFEAASVCTPTSAHFRVAEALLAAGVDALVEKPIATTVSEAGRLADDASEKGRILQVGHLERFNPAVTAAEAILNRPMFFEAHRLSVFSPRSLDVDVVLDLMVHDLDIVLSFVRSPVRSLQAVGLPILSRKVDIANVRVEFASGCVANFTASRVSTEKVRKLRFFQPHQYVSIDYARRDLLVIDVSAAGGTGRPGGGGFAAPTDQGPQPGDGSLDVGAGAGGTSRPGGSGFAANTDQEPQPGVGSVDVGAGAGGTSRPGGSGFAANTDQEPQPGVGSVDVGAGAAGIAGLPGLHVEKPAVEAGEPLRLELESFLEAVRTRSAPRVSGEDGRAALALALEINAAIAAHAERAGIGRLMEG